MKQLVAVLRAVGILGVVWGGLALVAWMAGVLPERGASSAGEAPTSRPKTATTDASMPEAATKSPTAPTNETSAAAASVARKVSRFTACDPGVARPTVSASHAIGDPRPEILVGCGPVVHVLALASPRPAPNAPMDTAVPFRVLTLDIAQEIADAPIHAAPPTTGDIDGDSLPDLVLGFWYGAEGGASRGGALYLVRQNATSAFDPPRRLAPISVVEAVTANLDARSGQEIVALHRGNTFARRPSELWVFDGGPSPARSSQLRTGIGGEGFAVADVNRDGASDLIAVTSEEGRIDVFFGDGTGRFPRSTTLKYPGARAVIAAELDGEPGLEVVVAGDEGLHRIQASSPETIELAGLDEPSKATALVAGDIDGDGKRDLLALVEEQVVWIRQLDASRFERTELSAMPGDLAKVVSMVLSDVDADGRPDLLVITRPSENDPWELVVMRDLRDPGPNVLEESVSPIDDAPLRLTVPLR